MFGDTPAAGASLEQLLTRAGEKEAPVQFTKFSEAVVICDVVKMLQCYHREERRNQGIATGPRYLSVVFADRGNVK